MPASTQLQLTDPGPENRPGRARHTYKVGELFSGAGGMALGASLAKVKGSRFSHVWAVDMDPDACDTLEKSRLLPAGKVICGKVEDVDFRGLSPIDGLAFGFPCNDFSIVGEQQGINGKFGGLYRWGVLALAHFKPAFFVAENVSGLMSSGNKKDVRTILDALEGEGYDLHVETYKFEEYGLPQARHRMIITGFRKDLSVEFQPPKKARKVKTCKDALENPPIPDNARNNERTAQHPRVVERLKHIRPGENVFTSPRMPKHLQLKMASGATMSQIYRRLDPSRPAYTITGSGGGGTHCYHWEENRALTNRERARLQTFPDSFVFQGSKESVRRQIGMAVPPAGAKIVFRAVLKSLLDNKVFPVHAD